MTARVSGPPRRSPSHRAFFCQGWVVLAESWNIDAGNPDLPLKVIHIFLVFVELEGFLNCFDCWVFIHGLLPSITGVRGSC